MRPSAPAGHLLSYAVSHGVSTRLMGWGEQFLRGWAPFGPAASGAWPIVVRQIDQPEILTDDQFVWGPQVKSFDLGRFLKGRKSGLAAYTEDLALWADYSSVNPQVLLTVLELRYGLVTNFPAEADAATVRSQIQTTAIDLATAFYDHLYTWGARSPQGATAQGSPPALALQDGSTVQITRPVSSGTYAISSVLGAASTLPTLQALTSPTSTDGFTAIFGSLFTGSDPLATNNPINPAALPPDSLFQFPFPLGATWYFSGPHSWNGGSSPPPFSSIDFYQGGATCAAPPSLYAVAAAGGSAYHPYGYTCWLEIDHGGGWTSSYYHLLNLTSGGAMSRNARLGSIACETCAGGFATGPHVHWSLKYNGAYVSLEGVKLSGWTIHVGPTAVRQRQPCSGARRPCRRTAWW